MTDAAALRSAVEAGVIALGGIDARPAGDGPICRAGVPFAHLDGEAVEVKVGATIAAAAVRTPDTTRSARGADWVRFAPAELDGHAVDRLGAWLAAAHRRAGRA